ncbi:FAD binding domain-containing protein [Mycena olivaceomarginata]|nr:FAD binding domain-containing protein [Mycena olivaceomarginata]
MLPKPPSKPMISNWDVRINTPPAHYCTAAPNHPGMQSGGSTISVFKKVAARGLEQPSVCLSGGPAGSYPASVLAREGISVTVLESAKFPRYHVGESLIPSVRHYMRFIGADEKLASHGFANKSSAVDFGPPTDLDIDQYKREGYTDFMALGTDNTAFNVVRSEFDHLLMNHARSCGASVYEQTKVTSISFSSVDPKRPVSVSWSHVPPPTLLSPPASPTTSTTPIFPSNPAPEWDVLTGTTTFTHLIDASGRAGLMSAGYLKNRHFNSSLKNVACWGYWSGAGIYGGGTSREGAPWFEALTGLYSFPRFPFIPLANGRTSVGVVMNQLQKIYNDKMKQPAEPTYFLPSSIPNPTKSIMINRYLCNILLAPAVAKLLGVAVMEIGSVKSATDFSYSAPSYADFGYRIIGDAGAFRVSPSYTRFQVVVLSAADVLSDIDENNFDRAFSFLRPGWCSALCVIIPIDASSVIQGASDMGKLLSQTELQKSLDFCVNRFNPTTPEQHDRVAGKPEISQALLDVAAPLVDPTHKPSSPPSSTLRLSKRDRSASEVAETRMVLYKINARRVSEPIAGHVVRLEKGCLGLTRLSVCTTPERAD